MKRLALALLLVASPVSAQTDPHDLDRLFSHQADVATAGAEAYRLPLGPEVLGICHRDLSDVRLYDVGGNEVPWLLDSASRRRGGAEQVQTVDAPVMRAIAHAAEGRARAPTAFHESYLIVAPGVPPARAAWDLLVGSARDHFVADVRVIAIGSDRAEHPIGSGSALRFVAPLRERLSVPVTEPGFGGVRVEIDGHDGFLDPTFTWVATRRERAGQELVIPLEIVSRSHEGTVTILEIARPSGVVPEALRFTTNTPAFARMVSVATGGASIDAVIWRAPGTPGAESYDVPAPVTRELSFRVRIDDQDSPPLDALTISAVLSRPVLLYFTPATLLRFGGGRVRAPRYDVGALTGSWSIDRLFDRDDAVPDSTLGPIRPSPGWTDAPALSPLQRPGTTVPATDHALTASLTVASAREGASRIVLRADVLAAARDDLSDLRVVDEPSQQWPYLLRDVEPLHLAVTLGRPTRAGDETRYELTLPAERVSATTLRLDPDASLVARAVRVTGIDPHGDEIELASARLDRYPGQTAAPIDVVIDPTHVTTMALYVTDGSETPLAFRSAELVVPTRELVLVAPPGSYRLLVGDDDARRPEYEIERARGLLDAIPIDDATLGPLGPAPGYRAPNVFDRAGTTTLALWAVLVLAIIVLGALTWRVSRTPETSTKSS